MASKKSASTGPLRGATLIKKAIETAKNSGEIADPEPVPSSLLKKLTLPNGEPISPAMKTLLAFDSSWIGIEFDDEEGEIDGMSLEEVVEQEIGEDAVGQFAEAYQIFGEDCVLLAGSETSKRFLYVGSTDAQGEYAVITLGAEGEAWVGGFVPFDVWVAQHLGALEAEKTRGWVPEEYATVVAELATANGDGRTSFVAKAGEVEGREDDDEDEEDDDKEEDSAE